MSNGKKLLNFRLTAEEADILAAYCKRTGRTQTDVLREFIRGLALPRRRAAARHPPAKAPRKGASKV